MCVCLKSGGGEVGESVVTVWGTTFFRVVTIAAGACVERLFKLSPWVLAVFPPCTASLVTTLERLRLCSSSIILADVCLPEKLQPTLGIISPMSPRKVAGWDLEQFQTHRQILLGFRRFGRGPMTGDVR